MTRRVLFEGSQEIIIRYNRHYARVYPSEVELSDCIKSAGFFFLACVLFLCIATKKKNVSAGFGAAGVNKGLKFISHDNCRVM